MGLPMQNFPGHNFCHHYDSRRNIQDCKETSNTKPRYWHNIYNRTLSYSQAFTSCPVLLMSAPLRPSPHTPLETNTFVTTVSVQHLSKQTPPPRGSASPRAHAADVPSSQSQKSAPKREHQCRHTAWRPQPDVHTCAQYRACNSSHHRTTLHITVCRCKDLMLHLQAIAEQTRPVLAKCQTYPHMQDKVSKVIRQGWYTTRQSQQSHKTRLVYRKTKS